MARLNLTQEQAYHLLDALGHHRRVGVQHERRNDGDAIAAEYARDEALKAAGLPSLDDLMKLAYQWEDE